MLAALSQQYKVIGCFAGGRDKRRQGRKGGEQRRIGYGRGLIGTSIIYPPPQKKKKKFCTPVPPMILTTGWYALWLKK